MQFLEITHGVKSAECAECERLLANFISTVRRTRAVLAERVAAENAGIIDDLDVLGSESLEAAFTARQQARAGYLQHRQRKHGPMRNSA
jgi:hypothetical protein